MNTRTIRKLAVLCMFLLAMAGQGFAVERDFVVTPIEYGKVRSTGAQWTQVTPSGSMWSGREMHTTVVFDNKLWVLGGQDGNLRNDVWSSADGVHWTQVTPSGSIWSPRENPTSAVFHNKLWVLGGHDGSSPLNDVWTYCLLYTSPSPRDGLLSRMPSSA